MADEQGEKKLHIDADWKEQARAERERLAREQEKTAKPAAAAGPGAGGVAAGAGLGGAASAGVGPRPQAAGHVHDESCDHDHEDEPLPPASFSSLVQTLATQAAMFLSPQRDPETGRTMVNIELAKHTIDLLSVLEEKTRGNLTVEEKRLLDTALYQTRMAYVRAAG